MSDREFLQDLSRRLYQDLSNRRIPSPEPPLTFRKDCDRLLAVAGWLAKWETTAPAAVPERPSKVVVQQTFHGYRVVGLRNRLSPKVETTLSEQDILALMADENLTVEVLPNWTPEALPNWTA